MLGIAEGYQQVTEHALEHHVDASVHLVERVTV